MVEQQSSVVVPTNCTPRRRGVETSDVEAIPMIVMCVCWQAGWLALLCDNRQHKHTHTGHVVDRFSKQRQSANHWTVGARSQSSYMFICIASFVCESVCMSPVCFTILVLSVSPAATTTHRTDRPTTIRPAAEQSRARVAQRPKRARWVIQQFSIVCVCVGSGRVSKIVRSFAAPRFRSVPPSLLSQPASHSVSVWFGGVVRLCSAFRVAPLFFLKYNIGVVCVLLLLFAFLLRSSSCSASKPNATPLTVHDTGRLVGTLECYVFAAPPCSP